MKFNVEVELEGDYDSPSIEQQLFEAAATKLIHGPWKGSADIDALRSKVEGEVQRRIKEGVDERLNEIIDSVLAEGVFQIDTYGRRKGEPKPLVDVCRDEIAKKLGNQNGYNFNSQVTNAVGKVMAKQLHGVVQEKIAEFSKRLDEDFYAQLATEFRKKAGLK